MGSSRLRRLGPHLSWAKPTLPHPAARPTALAVFGLLAVLALPLPPPVPVEAQPSTVAVLPTTPPAGNPALAAPGTAPKTTTPPKPTTRPVTRSRPPEQLTGYIWPIPNARVTTWYAPTRGGFLHVDGKRVHGGIDLATFCGDSVLAAHDGTVIYSGRRFDPHVGYIQPPDAFYALLAEKKVADTALAIVVVVDDGNGYRSLYVHLSKSHVKAGDKVTAGQVIGREGATGNASGCHLHYELIRMDGPYQAVAPQLTDKWRYPPLVRERVDPMRVLSLAQPGAGRKVPGIPPPVVSPGFGVIDLYHPVTGADRATNQER
jgi:murein DD-endopeptidase MepM/ murein hydrolase activator NlpD